MLRQTLNEFMGDPLENESKSDDFCWKADGLDSMVEKATKQSYYYRITNIFSDLPMWLCLVHGNIPKIPSVPQKLKQKKSW